MKRLTKKLKKNMDTFQKKLTELPKHITDYKKYFDPQKFWEVITKHGREIGRSAVRQALVMFYMYKDGLKWSEKAMILGALGYLILPTDLIPDFIPIVGWSDDIGAIAYVWTKLKDKADPEAIKKADHKVKEWFGKA